MDPRQGRRPRLRAAAALLALLPLPGCGSGGSGAPPPPPPSGGSGSCAVVSGTPALSLRRVATGLDRPLDLQAVPGDRRRLCVVEQAGRIRLLRDGSLLEAPFLDISGRIAAGGERGLLGLAFHPRYAENGRFFVNYTDRNGDTHIAEFRVSSDPERADAASERLLLFVAQPFANHNGGGLQFGPDGKLYAGLGDGGSAGDPQGNGQNLGTFLGKLLRLDVDAGTPYGVPSDNPFVGRAGARPEIWAFGLRNPWRFAFDSATGDLFIADVGQGSREEIDVEPAPRRGGVNYGWNTMEGTRCFQPSSGCNQAGLALPVLDYGHDQGCSVTGGVVYRGCRLPGYLGTYFYSDYCSAFVRSFRFENGRAVDARDWTSSLGQRLSAVSAFGTDLDGEVYVIDYGGSVYALVPAS